MVECAGGASIGNWQLLAGGQMNQLCQLPYSPPPPLFQASQVEEIFTSKMLYTFSNRLIQHIVLSSSGIFFNSDILNKLIIVLNQTN